MFAFREKSLGVTRCQSFSQSNHWAVNLDSLAFGGRQKQVDPCQR
jgi:hypothetical protein